MIPLLSEHLGMLAFSAVFLSSAVLVAVSVAAWIRFDPL